MKIFILIDERKIHERLCPFHQRECHFVIVFAQNTSFLSVLCPWVENMPGLLALFGPVILVEAAVERIPFT